MNELIGVNIYRGHIIICLYTCEIVKVIYGVCLSELVVSVEREGDVIYWSRPSGRVSYYLVTLTDDETGEKLVEGMRTNEQFLVLSNGSYGKLSVEVCSI